MAAVQNFYMEIWVEKDTKMDQNGDKKPLRGRLISPASLYSSSV